MIDPIHQHREEILRIAAKYGATDVRVFGSMARGEANPSSDVDLLVRVVPGTSLLDLGGMWHELHELLGRDIDIVTAAGLRRGVRERVLAEAIAI